MIQKCAAIDIGTNSMRLLLAEVENNRFIRREKHLKITRIGRSVDAGGYITDRGMALNIQAFTEFVSQARNFGAEEVWAIATSAVRDAKNGQDFADRALKETGITIEIIDGSHEAQLGYQGVLMGSAEQNSLTIIDIGGGSTEVIVGAGASIKTARSYNVGALRMTERLIATDPISEEEYKGLAAEIKKLLAPIKTLAHQGIKELTGIGGTATTIAAMCQQLDPYDPDKVHGYRIPFNTMESLRERLKKMNIAQKRRLKGLQPQRADIILAGTTIMTTAMALLRVDELVVSEYDNLEGIIYEKLLNQPI